MESGIFRSLKSLKIVNFMTHRTGLLMLLMLGCGHISQYSEYALSSTLSIYSTLVAILLRDCNAPFLCHCCFSFIL